MQLHGSPYIDNIKGDIVLVATAASDRWPTPVIESFHARAR